MKKFFDVLRKCPLFNGVEDENLIEMFDCIDAKITTYDKNQMILSEGEKAKYIGIVLSGSAQIMRIDYFGNRSIVATVGISEIFGESFACAEMETIPVDVVAVERTGVMFIDYAKMLHMSSNTRKFYQQIIFNLIKIIATKNILVNQKIEITSKRTTRDKLMTYLMLQAKKNKSNCFDIPYARQALADYLEVDRSGLSAEIGKLSREGVLISKRNHFELL